MHRIVADQPAGVGAQGEIAERISRPAKTGEAAMWSRIFVRFITRLITTGDLTLHLPDGTVLRLGDGTGPAVRAHIHDPGLFRKFVLNAELALGEAYMDETLTVEGDDLYNLLHLGIRNLNNGEHLWIRRLETALRDSFRRITQHNPVGKAQANVAHHYDLSGRLYDLFLDADKQYSCAYFERPGMSLEEAQAAKKALIARKLLLEPGMRVLDIGCGWGGMALTLARDYGVHVTGVTLSKEQHAVAEARARDAGLAHRVTFLLRDYRDLDEQFDRIVSVGMFEHVGAPHFGEFFSHVHDLLQPDGVALLHTIGRTTPPGSTNPWIAKYIFPGGYIPAMSETLAAIEHQDLLVTDVEVWRLHYAETLKAWSARFEANRDKIRALYDDRFCRMWRFYLTASELAFRDYGQEVFHFQIARAQDAVPLTREYLAPPRGAARTGHSPTRQIAGQTFRRPKKRKAENA